MRLARRTKGFTLVEVLVATCLLGIIGVISWRALDFVVTQRQRIDRDTESITRIVRVLSQIERDIAQLTPSFTHSPIGRALSGPCSVQSKPSGSTTS